MIKLNSTAILFSLLLLVSCLNNPGHDKVSGKYIAKNGDYLVFDATGRFDYKLSELSKRDKPFLGHYYFNKDGSVRTSVISPHALLFEIEFSKDRKEVIIYWRPRAEEALRYTQIFKKQSSE